MVDRHRAASASSPPARSPRARPGAKERRGAAARGLSGSTRSWPSSA